MDSGSGTPVVLLHGFTSSFAGTWDRTGWVGLLTGGGRRVVGLDFPSHGESEPVFAVERCKPERLVADVLALLDHTEVERADLIGFSMGAGVALGLAMTHPSRVTRLVLGGIGDAAVNALHDRQQLADIAKAFQAERAEDVARPEAASIRRSAEQGGASVKALLPFLLGSGWPGGLDKLEPIAAPILLFVAEDDEYMAGTQTLEGWLSPAEVLRLSGRGHHDVLRDDRLKRRVLAFLQPLVTVCY
jgi:pimeloyl-ACP methyl ester carboxylesterase